MTAARQALESWTHRWAILNGIRLHYVEAGQGPLVILLHGFPDFWYVWRQQIPTLAAAGFRVLAPDLRGYNESDKPPGVESYRMAVLLADVLGLVALAGAGRAHIVGHDWGGGIAWALAMHHPAAVGKLVILNSPHPAIFLRELRRPRQLLRSWYLFFFQLPWLPEMLFGAKDYALLERAWRRPVGAPAVTDEDIRRFKQALSRPGSLTAAINYYRAAFRHLGPLGQTLRLITAPTLLLWGERDPYLGVRLTEGLDPWVPDLRIERFPEAGHWVQSDVPEQVNQSLVTFLRERGG